MHTCRSCVRNLRRVCLLAGALASPARSGPADDAPPPASQHASAPDETRWLRNVRQLTSEKMGLERSGEAYFSPDGKRVCFQAYPKGKHDYQIYMLNVDGSGLRMLSTGEGATTCSFFHPTQDKVLFASNHLDPRPAEPPPEAKAAGAGSRYAWPFQPGMDIFVRDLRSNELTQLTRGEGYDAEGSYSPDGKHIVFTSMRDGDQEIYICDADGANPRRITRAAGYDGGPFFSPDGKRIVYRSDRRNRNDGTLQIFINNTEGTEERAITGDDVLNWCPYWHPSGKWLIFTRGLHPENGPPAYDLYLVRDDGTQLTRVTTDPGFDGLPVFSADGKRLMWTSKRGGLESPQIFIADFVGLTPQGELAAPR